MSVRARATRKAEALRQRLGLSYEQLVGWRFAVNVFIATTIVWITLRVIGDTNPIWAIASMVAASDPEPAEGRRLLKSRLTNVLVGCGVAFAFLLAFGNRTHWVLPLALATTVLISTNVVRVKTMWRQAPITAAVVLAAAITTAHATEAGFGQGLHKVAEVIFGCLVGVGVSWTTSKIWLLRPEPGGAEGA